MKTPPDDLIEKLMKAADSFGGTGLDVSIDDVAQASGVPRATLYYYFSGKNDLLDFYLTQKLDTMSAAMQKAVAHEGSVVERLQACIRAVLVAMAEQPALCLELPEAMRRAQANHSEVALKAESVMRNPLRDLVIEGKATGVLDVTDVDVTVDAISGAVQQVAMAQLMKPESFDPNAIADAIVPVMIRGLTK